MKRKARTPMSVAERAKQFMPFSAVRGLNAALRRKEQELGMVSPKILTEEAAAELDAKLQQLQKGSFATVTYFCHRRQCAGSPLQRDFSGRYVQSSGRVLALDRIGRRLTLVADANGVISIALADIIEIDFF